MCGGCPGADGFDREAHGERGVARIADRAQLQTPAGPIEQRPDERHEREADQEQDVDPKRGGELRVGDPPAEVKVTPMLYCNRGADEDLHHG